MKGAQRRNSGGGWDLGNFMVTLIVLLSSVSSVAQSCPTLRSHGLQHARLPCPSPTPEDCSNTCPSSRWCHPIISSSVVPFSSCLQSFPASGSFQMSRFFVSGGQSIGASASASRLFLGHSKNKIKKLFEKDDFYKAWKTVQLRHWWLFYYHKVKEWLVDMLY